MINSFFGFKKEQVSTFDEKGNRLVVTKVSALPCFVTQIKTPQKDGYWAVQLGFGKRKFGEVSLEEEPKVNLGDKVSVAQVFKKGDKLKVTGRTKGKGFAGVVKRWGFAGGPKTHGQSDRERAPGSIGQRTQPGRVWKGKKMAGRMGGKRKTIKGLKVFKVNEENNELWIQGLVPGGKGGVLKIAKLA